MAYLYSNNVGVRRMSWFRLPRFLRRALNLRDVDGGQVTFLVAGDHLEITIISGWDTFRANVSMDQVDKLVTWMNQAIPRRSTGVTKSGNVLPLFRASPDSARGPRRPK